MSKTDTFWSPEPPQAPPSPPQCPHYLSRPPFWRSWAPKVPPEPPQGLHFEGPGPPKYPQDHPKGSIWELLGTQGAHKRPLGCNFCCLVSHLQPLLDHFWGQPAHKMKTTKTITHQTPRVHFKMIFRTALAEITLAVFSLTTITAFRSILLRWES